MPSSAFTGVIWSEDVQERFTPEQQAVILRAFEQLRAVAPEGTTFWKGGRISGGDNDHEAMVSFNHPQDRNPMGMELMIDFLRGAIFISPDGVQGVRVTATDEEMRDFLKDELAEIFGEPA